MLVARPDVAALREAGRSSSELRALGIDNQQLAVNAVFHAQDKNDAVAVAFERKGTLALQQMPEGLRALPRFDVPLKGYNMVGLSGLRRIFDEGAPPASTEAPTLPGLSEIIDELAKSQHALVMVMGKGGVGQTTIAVELAARGVPVHLSTTDPAAHLTNTVVGTVEHLQVARIDPVAETKA